MDLLLIFAIGVNYFAIPNRPSEGGILGITIIAHYLFHWSPGIVNFVLNVALLSVGYKFFEKRAFVYTLISIAATSGFLFFTVNKQEIVQLKRTIHEIDENAYVTMHNVLK